MSAFNDLGLNARLIRNIEKQGYEEPTAIQQSAIPLVLSGDDVMASAQTGTGKTAAFTLPILQLLNNGARPGPKDVHCLVITPTRELAAQVAESIRTYSNGLKLNSEVVCGGVNIRPQIRNLSRGTDILVATPGRLIDLLGQNALRLDHVKLWVLDEADRMLDMGFIPAVRQIQSALPKVRQTLMFSATFSRPIEALAGEFLHQPKRVSVTPANTTVSRITQKIYPVDRNRKGELLNICCALKNGARCWCFPERSMAPTSCLGSWVKRGSRAIRFMETRSRVRVRVPCSNSRVVSYRC